MDSFLQCLLLPEASTSSPSHLSTFPGRVSEPEHCWGEPWGCQVPHTVNVLRKTPLPPLGTGFFFFFWLNDTVTPSRHQGLKLLSKAWSLPAECLTSRWGEGGGSYVMGGTESRAETDSKSLSCHGLTSLLPHPSVCSLLSTCWLCTMSKCMS